MMTISNHGSQTPTPAHRARKFPSSKFRRHLQCRTQSLQFLVGHHAAKGAQGRSEGIQEEDEKGEEESEDDVYMTGKAHQHPEVGAMATKTKPQEMGSHLIHQLPSLTRRAILNQATLSPATPQTSQTLPDFARMLTPVGLPDIPRPVPHINLLSSGKWNSKDIHRHLTK